MKDLGEADIILSIEIIRDNDRLCLSQSHYIEKILKRFDMFDVCPVSNPMDISLKLFPNHGKPHAQLDYSKIIGSLMYAMTCTSPDIAYSVAKLSRFTSNPGSIYWLAIKRVLRYLKGTIDYGIVYSGKPPVLEGYSDAT